MIECETTVHGKIDCLLAFTVQLHHYSLACKLNTRLISVWLSIFCILSGLKNGQAHVLTIPSPSVSILNTALISKITLLSLHGACWSPCDGCETIRSLDLHRFLSCRRLCWVEFSVEHFRQRNAFSSGKRIYQFSVTFSRKSSNLTAHDRFATD